MKTRFIDTDKRIAILVITAGLLLLAVLLIWHRPIERQGYFTIEKTSDSEWQVSQTNYPDTTIRDTVLIDGMVLYPTTHYLRVLN